MRRSRARIENKLPLGPHAPTPEPSSDGCPGPCHSGYIFSQLLVSLHVRCLLAQVHQKGMPARVTPCPGHSKRETSRELDLHLKLSAGAEKTRHCGASGHARGQ